MTLYARVILVAAPVLAAVFPVVGGSGRAAAQNVLSVLAKPIGSSAALARRACIALPYKQVFVVQPRSKTCRVVRYVVMDSAAGSAWSSALYRRTSVYDFTGNPQPDTIVELEFVLVRTRSHDAGRVDAVAHVRVDYDNVLDISAEWATHGASSLLGVKFEPNNNGGGCDQDFLQLHDSQWHELGEGVVAAELTRRGILPGPAGTSLRTVSCLDVHTLRGTSGLWSDTDATHFPSRTVDFQLELTNQGFRLVTLAVANEEADQPDSPATRAQPDARQLEIRFIDVGQGDAVLIRHGADAVLIDAGLPDDSLVRTLHALHVDSLRAFVASHNHGDHIGSAGAVLQAFPVALYVENDAPVSTPGAQRVDEAIRQRKVPRERATRRAFVFDDVRLDVFPPPAGVDTAQNNHSIVVLVQRGTFRALLTGDSERSEIDALLAHDTLPGVNVLKAPHHGDEDALSEAWFRQLNPAVIVVSVGAGNLSDEARRRYSAPGRRLYSTDQAGDVTVLVDASGSFTVRAGPRRSH